MGLVHWSLDRPGLTSGFVPEQIAADLDFLAVHIYPQTGEVDEAIETLKGFAAVGKPVIIEETFTLKCGADELGQFIDRSQSYATGWIGFYWGKTPDEYRPPKSIAEALTLSWLELFQERRRKYSRANRSILLAEGASTPANQDQQLPGRFATSSPTPAAWPTRSPGHSRRCRRVA